MSFHLIMDIACFPSSRNDGVGIDVPRGTSDSMD